MHEWLAKLCDSLTMRATPERFPRKEVLYQVSFIFTFTLQMPKQSGKQDREEKLGSYAFARMYALVKRGQHDLSQVEDAGVGFTRCKKGLHQVVGNATAIAVVCRHATQ